jgi:hypothetical protein
MAHAVVCLRLTTIPDARPSSGVTKKPISAPAPASADTSVSTVFCALTHSAGSGSGAMADSRHPSVAVQMAGGVKKAISTVGSTLDTQTSASDLRKSSGTSQATLLITFFKV